MIQFLDHVPVLKQNRGRPPVWTPVIERLKQGGAVRVDNKHQANTLWYAGKRQGVRLSTRREGQGPEYIVWKAE